MRQFTQHEINAIGEAEQKIRPQGHVLIAEGDGSEADVEHNIERILSYFTLNSQIQVTVESVLEMFRIMHAQFRWKTAARIEYETVYNALTKSQQDAFGAWWFSPSTKKTIVVNGEEGFANAAKIINWMRGKTFDARNLNLAITNLASSRGLHWAPTPKQTDPRQHSGDASFMKKSETNLTARDHAARRAAYAAAAAGNKPAPPTDYKALAESITTGRTHSDSLKLQKLFVMKRDNPTEIDWEQTAYQRQRLADGKAR